MQSLDSFVNESTETEQLILRHFKSNYVFHRDELWADQTSQTKD